MRHLLVAKICVQDTLSALATALKQHSSPHSMERLESGCGTRYMFCWRKAHQDTWPGWSWQFLNRQHQRAFLSMALPQIGTLMLQAAIGQSSSRKPTPIRHKDMTKSRN